MRRLLISCGLAALVAILAGCHRTPDEAQVRAAIGDAAHAAEQADAGGTVASLSDDFDGNAGSLDRRNLGNLIRLAHLRGEHLGVTLGPVTVERRGERMIARFTASLTQGTRLLPDAAGVYRIETAWRKDDGQWVCYSATWERQL